MSPLPSPAAFLPDGALALIRDTALAAEAGRDLAPPVLDLVYREGWFRLLVPRRWGGKALALPQLVRLEEGLAFADGSVGWTVTLCSGAGWFAGFFPGRSQEAAAGAGKLAAARTLDGLLGDDRLCIAGSGSVGGEAQMVEGGYRVSGSWGYASGIRHATALTANCRVTCGGEAVAGPDGQPLIRPFLFLPGEVRVQKDWNAMGLVATGSHGFSVEGLQVPAERAFRIDPTAATDADPLYQYPFLPLAEVTLAANLSGMGQHFLDGCEGYFRRRSLPEAVDRLARARAELAAMREEFYRVLDRSWEVVGRGEPAGGGFAAAAAPNEPVFVELGRLSHEMAAKVRDWADRLYPFAGLGAAGYHTEINRVWRDLHTAAQHPLLVF